MIPFRPCRNCNLTSHSKPTNHLDIEGLDALMAALNKWNGGVILISHDERFITTVAKEVSFSSIPFYVSLISGSYGYAVKAR